ESWHMWALYGAYGVYYGVASGTARALIADLVPVELRGTAYGAYATVVGAMAFPASLLAGILWDFLSPKAPFFFGGALASLAAVLLLLWRPRSSPTPPERTK
ncbi:MAG: MFS transporter, partial [Candidatus Bipolaricaulaceae bacterium]